MYLYSPSWDETRAPRGWRWIWENRKKKKSRIRTGMEKDGVSPAGTPDSSGKTKTRLWMEYQFELIEAHRKAD